MDFDSDDNLWVVPTALDGDAQKSSARRYSSSGDTYVDHFRQLNIMSEPFCVRQTGIICSIGESSRSIKKLEDMLEAGMSCARVNLSYNDYGYHRQTIAMIREAVHSYSNKIKRVFPLPVAVDTKGSEIRTGNLDSKLSERIELKEGSELQLTTKTEWKDYCNDKVVYIDYGKITKLVKAEDKICLDYGNIVLLVKKVDKDNVICNVKKGGTLRSYRAVHIPEIPLSISSLSSTDHERLLFAVQQGVDVIFASNVYNSGTIKEIRDVICEKGQNMMVISKIENFQSLENIDNIISESDGILISRRSLSINLPHEKVFLIQKIIAAKCVKAGKPVICATQVLESMANDTEPSRIEVVDVGNALCDGVDNLMLASETCVRKHVVESIKNLDAICRDIEQNIYHKNISSHLKLNVNIHAHTEPSYVVIKAAIAAANECCASAIVCVTTSGRTAYLLCACRPKCPVICVTRYGQVARRLQLWKNALPVQYINKPVEDVFKETDLRILYGIKFGKQNRFIHKGDPVVVVNCWRPNNPGFNNTVRVVYASESDVL